MLTAVASAEEKHDCDGEEVAVEVEHDARRSSSTVARVGSMFCFKYVVSGLITQIQWMHSGAVVNAYSWNRKR